MERENLSGYYRTHNPRSVIVGDVKDGFKFTIGQSVGKFIVSRIIKDENYMKIHGQSRVLVYVKNNGRQDHLWKEYVGVPMSYEFEIGS